MNDKQLLQFYLNTREPDAYQWNLSPESLYLELETRDFLLRNFTVFSGMKACNIGIGAGGWDDFLGYFLGNNGRLISIDLDPEISEMFSFRQRREGHPNPSNVICCDFLTCPLPETEYDLVTMIGSTAREIGAYSATFEKIGSILKPNGYVMYMDFERYFKKEELSDMLHLLNMKIEKLQEYDRFLKTRFYCMKIRKISGGAKP